MYEAFQGCLESVNSEVVISSIANIMVFTLEAINLDAYAKKFRLQKQNIDHKMVIVFLFMQSPVTSRE